jgi:hypothetical protein
VRGHGPFIRHFFEHPAVPIIHAATPGTDWPAWITAIGTLVIASGVFIAARQVNEAKRATNIDSAVRFSSRWEADELADARIEIDKSNTKEELQQAFFAAMDNRKPERHLFLRELSFFDDLGAMEKLGGVSLQWIEATMKDMVLERWALWEPTIIELRSRQPQVRGDQPTYGNFERIVRKLSGQDLSTIQRLKRWIVLTIGY